MNILELTGMKSTKYGGVEPTSLNWSRYAVLINLFLYTSRCQSVKTM